MTEWYVPEMSDDEFDEAIGSEDTDEYLYDHIPSSDDIEEVDIDRERQEDALDAEAELIDAELRDEYYRSLDRED